MMFVAKSYKRSRDLLRLSVQAAARVERRNGMRIRRGTPAAVVSAELIVKWGKTDP